MKIAGLDIGTTGCKCTVFDEDGTYLRRAYRDYPVRRAVGAHEIDVSVLMEAVYEVIREAAAGAQDLAGIGVTSFGETFVLTDEAGNPLRPAMLYTDPRGAEECRELAQAFAEGETEAVGRTAAGSMEDGAEAAVRMEAEEQAGVRMAVGRTAAGSMEDGARRIAAVTGLRPHEMYSLPKLMWVKAHEPGLFARAEHVFLMEDFVVWHLTGKAQIDDSLASRTMAFDIRSLSWSQEVLRAAGIDPGFFSEPVRPGTAAGPVTALAAERTGLSEKTIIVSVGHDQVAAAVGAGAFDASAAVDGAGTVQCLTPVYESLPDMDAMYEGYFSVVPYVVPGTYVAYAFSYTGGALLQWCVDTVAKKEKETAKTAGISVNAYLEQQYEREREEAGDSPEIAAGPSGLLVLPHFAGAATPYMDTGSEGAVIGLTVQTTAADLYRGCMEGVAYEMYLNYEKLKGSGVRFTRLHATGGGARSKVWMQMKADVLGIPITALSTVDAGTAGSAMLTGIAVGVFADLFDAAGRMVEKRETYEPRQKIHEAYMEVYQRYARLYDAVRPLCGA